MPRRVAVALLTPPRWAPPGVDRTAWRVALADDLLDVFATMIEVEPALALPVGDDLPIGWPGLRRYELASLDVASVFAAVAADGFEQAALVAGDVPDLPGMLIAKLLRPLTSKTVAAAPAHGTEPGLLGLSAVLPAPNWLPAEELDTLTPQALRRRAPAITDVAPAPGWHRLRGAEDLARLDPRLEGWDATRALLSGRR
jgi:hypothetical protein